ncbi:HutD family protein [Rhodococcus fascians]|nr:HutD family protein [Rhodococcus fascians]MBY4114550.1 HutD family protein [Rhodococcus fascians]
MTDSIDVTSPPSELGPGPVVVAVRDASTRLWRNGEGLSTHLYAHTPPTAAEPSWTLSLAKLDSSAHFSSFPGYDRHFMVAGHNRVVLDVGGRSRPVAYTEVAQFPGEATVRVETVAGPSLALNLMVQRSNSIGDMTFGRIDGERTVNRRQVSAYVLLSGALRVQGRRLDVRGDTVVIGSEPVVLAGRSAVLARIRVQHNNTESRVQ